MNELSHETVKDYKFECNKRAVQVEDDLYVINLGFLGVTKYSNLANKLPQSTT